MTSYNTILAEAEDEFVEKRSRFIGAITPVKTAEEALGFIARRKALHRDARHTVYAYILREGSQRYSDDGEPQGTAGQPMLNVFQREEITNVCCVVTRYFGGVLLGAGGLSRAYARGAKAALDAAGVSRVSRWTLWEVPCTYPLLERVKLELAAAGAVVENTDYGADITLLAAFPQGGAERFASRLTELSAGVLSMEKRGEDFRSGPREAR